MPSQVPISRIEACNSRKPNSKGKFALYWMVAARRLEWNFGLQRAVQWCRQLNKPLLILEALRCDYPWASRRLHAFVLQGMAEHQQRLAGSRTAYYPFVERTAGEGKGLLSALARQACLVVTDDYPAFFLPRMIASAATQIDVLCEKVDSNGLLPMRAAEDRVFTRAYDFRRFLQTNLRPHLAEFPVQFPLVGDPLPQARIPPAVTRKWPLSVPEELLSQLDTLPIDQQVRETSIRGGASAAGSRLADFLDRGLPRYSEEKNQAEASVTSGLSPYLHFGHLSAHQVVAAVLDRESVSPVSLRPTQAGKRQSWWDISGSAQEFLDQLLTWREIGFNFCHLRDDYARYDSLPEWALRTLEEHRDDPRPHAYELDQLAAGETHDRLWNAAQRQLTTEGTIHNYLRMLWGKKILKWSPSPEQAAGAMIHLNDKFALDGRDPNSYSGIFWCLGRYDRAWGPERPIFGKIRYMTSRNTARKLKVEGYLARYLKR